MSHFTCLVISSTAFQKDLEQILLPFHEYECTGIEEYTQELDETDDVMARWEEYEDKDEYDNSVGKFAEEYYGYRINDEGRFVRKTNPNAKWDWWVIGGRWKGLLRAKEGALTGSGQSGTGGSHYDHDGIDQVQIKNLDIDKMEQVSKEHKKANWESYEAKIASDEIKADDKVMRELIHGLPPKEECPTLEEYLAQPYTFSTYALVKDGKWYERGQMGWWGMASNEDTPEEWDKKFTELVKDLDPESWITVVDCHI